MFWTAGALPYHRLFYILLAASRPMTQATGLLTLNEPSLCTSIRAEGIIAGLSRGCSGLRQLSAATSAACTFGRRVQTAVSPALGAITNVTF